MSNMSESNKNMSQPNNPYAKAAGAYDQNARSHTPDQRELEARVLLKAVGKMQTLQENWEQMTAEELDDVLTYNRQIWLMFVDTAIEDSDPERSVGLRNNIANLGLFIFKHILDILARPKKEKLDILIEINREIASGLMARQNKEDGNGQDKSEEKQKSAEDRALSPDITG